MSSKPIFLSHAVEDKPIADLVVDELLIGGMGLSHDDIFYTSLHETGIRAGADFITTIKSEIQTPKIVLMLISRNYLVKPFCIAEAGACWAMSHTAIPILVPPTTYSDMEGVIAPKQASTLDASADWHAILDEFKRNLNDFDPNTNRWTRLLDKFLEAIPPLLEIQPKPNRVSRAEHDKVVRELADANKEIEDIEEELEIAKNRNEALAKLKDSEAVAKVDLSMLPSPKQFSRLTHSVKEALRKLPYGTRIAVFYHHRDEGLTWEELRRRRLTEEIEDDIKREFVNSREEDGVVLNDEHPLVEEAIDSLDELDRWMKGRVMELDEFATLYQREHKIPFSLSNEDFWKKHLLR